MKRFSKPLNKVDLSSPVFFRWYRWFRVLNQTAQTRRHLALFFIIWDPSGLDFEGRVEVKRTQGVLNSDKILTTELRLLTSAVREMCSLLGGHFKICGQREVWNQHLCLIPRVFSFSNERTLGTRLKSLFALDFPKVFEFPIIPAPS